LSIIKCDFSKNFHISTFSFPFSTIFRLAEKFRPLHFLGYFLWFATFAPNISDVSGKSLTVQNFQI